MQWRWRRLEQRRRFTMASRKMCNQILVYILFLRHTLQWLSFMFLAVSEPLSRICLRICSSKTSSCTRTPRCFVIFFFQTRSALPPPKQGFKKFEGRAFFSALLIDEMFPLPRQLFRPFSLENSQWHPVRFASWFICHISFISLNSLYLSSGSMHLSWAPRQCLQQARSKHILHVTLQLQLQLAYFTLGV